MSARDIEHVIVDRDGTLNRELQDGWLSSAEQWEWEEGSLEALRLLARVGIRISVVSNQSGIGRGAVSRGAVDEVHRWLMAELAAVGVELAGVFICPHAPGDGCPCRKPLPGMIHEAIADSGIPAERTILIGDDERDLDAGEAAGVRVALVQTGKGKSVRSRIGPDTLIFDNLLEAIESIVEV